MSRVYNFSAGPAVMPLEVLVQAQAEMLDWNGSGMSIMEMSHRSKEYLSVAERAERDLRDLLAIPSNYKVLFLQGGASTQFALLPMNLATAGSTTDYLVTGMWSEKARAEASKFNKVNVVATTADSKFTSVPLLNDLRFTPGAAYVHYTPNETIQGVEFPYIPASGEVPLIGDFSSTLLSRPLDISRFGVVYAGAQKNVGPAGLTLVIIREDLLERSPKNLPSMFSYAIQAEAGSMYNTPATFSWYLAGLVFTWLKKQGGLAAMGERNQRKAAKLYAAIDQSGFYRCPVEKSARSWMNVPFTLKEAALDQDFLKQAEARNLSSLQGHRAVGGMRASLYNAMPEEGVDALITFMQEFAKRHG